MHDLYLVEKHLEQSASEDDRRLAKTYYSQHIALANELLFPKVIQGERRAALRLLELCGHAVFAGVELPPLIATWFRDFLSRVANGESVEEAAQIPKRPRGAKKEASVRANSERRFLIAHQYGIRFKHERTKKIASALEVANLFGIDVETVYSAWKDHQQEALHEIAMEHRITGKVMKITSPQELIGLLTPHD